MKRGIGVILSTAGILVGGVARAHDDGAHDPPGADASGRASRVLRSRMDAKVVVGGSARGRLGTAATRAAFVGVAIALLASAGCHSDVQPEGSVATIREGLSTCIDAAEVGDATLENPPMNRNSGADRVLRVGTKREALLQFDLGAVPVGASLDRATLSLSIAGGDDNDDSDDDACERDGEAHHHCPTINLHRATAPWSESTVTFASFAQHFASDLAGSFSLTSRHTAKSVDLTGLVASWLSGAKPNDGLLLETRSRRGSVFVSREGLRAEDRPRLHICFTTPENHCAPAPCLNGGTCANNPTGYTCACPPGFSGASCETQINNCATSPCLNGGTCTNGVNSYTCGCAAGFTGQNCEINIDDCAGNPCQNGGVCEDGIASYQCHCATGYTGTKCETLVNECGSAPCQNGGTCTNGVGNYSCACPAGFAGTNCEVNVDDCVGNACQNGATCIDGINAYTCTCPPDWGGVHCELNLNDCAQNPCLNGATCQNGLGAYTCSCAPGYSGTNCEVDINDCAPNPCQHGAVCVDGVNSHTCVCANGYAGANCEITPVATVPWSPAAPTLPHPVLSGRPTTLKGVALTGAAQYKWDFGDGTPGTWSAIADPNNLAATHVYVGPPGVLFFATLSVRASAAGLPYTPATYPLQIADPTASPDPRIAIAVDEALWHLHVTMARTTFPAGVPGYGLPAGSFADPSSLYGSSECAAAEAFERHGSKAKGAVAMDPYADDVRRLLNFTIAGMRPASVAQQYDQYGNQLGNDQNGNQLGISFYDSSYLDAKEWGLCGQALALGLGPSDLMPLGSNGVYGRPFADVAQDLVDFLATTVGYDGHVLSYYWNGDHATAFVAQALSSFSKLGVVTPPHVRSAFGSDLAARRDTTAQLCGGTGILYANDSVDIAATAGALYEGLFLGAGASDPSQLAEVGFLFRYWGTPVVESTCPVENKSTTSYLLQLGLRASSLSSVSNFACDGSGGATSFDWFASPLGSGHPGIASTLVSTQSVDGHWSDSGSCNDRGDANATALNISTLLGAGAAAPSAVVCDCANLAYNVYQNIPFDGSCSSAGDASRTLTRYEWDFHYRGSQATFNPEATGAQTTLLAGFPQYSTFPVALRVTDDNPQGAAQSIAVCNVAITPPPHCPIPSPGGGSSRTYLASVNVPVQLDAGASFDADADPLTFNWSLNGNGMFGDATGPTPSFTYATPGAYAVAVQVTDHPSWNAVPYNAASCTKTSYAVVIVGSPP